MDRDMVIDLLHAMICQLDGHAVTLDGEMYFVDKVCESAIALLETITNAT